MIAISPQAQANSRKSMRQGKLTFPILSDAKGEVGAAFGLRFKMPDYLIELAKGLKHDLPAFNDDVSWTLPMPARYVIDRMEPPKPATTAVRRALPPPKICIPSNVPQAIPKSSAVAIHPDRVRIIVGLAGVPKAAAPAIYMSMWMDISTSK